MVTGPSGLLGRPVSHLVVHKVEVEHARIQNLTTEGGTVTANTMSHGIVEHSWNVKVRKRVVVIGYNVMHGSS